MRISSMVCVAATAAVVSLCSPASAAISYEGFDGSGGSGFAGAWSSVSAGSAVQTGPSLSYGTLATSGGSMQLTTGSKPSTAAISRTLSTPIVSNPGGSVTTPVVYVSMLLQPEAPVQAWRTGLDLTLSGGTTSLNLGAINSNNWRVSSSLNYSNGSAISASSTVFAVIRFTPQTWNVTDIAVWLNPSASSLGEPTAPAPTYSSTTNMGFTFNTLTLKSDVSSDGLAPSTFKGTFDEFRQGSTWADVTPVAVPEPAALGILGAASALLMGRRRK